MTAILAAFGALAIFAATQAVYWRIAARRTDAVELLRARLGLAGDDDEIVRARAQEDTLAILLAQSGLGWTKADYGRRTAILAVGLGLIASLRAGPAAGLGMAILGVGAVYSYVVYSRDKRIALVTAQMPRALELMTLTLRAGHSLPRAVAVVAEEMPAPTGIELRRVAEETELGRPIEESFAAMSRRLPGVAPLRALVTGINVLGKTGGNLIDVLDRVVDFAAQQSQFQQRIRALTAENRASSVILGAIPPGFSLLATLVNPGYFNSVASSSLGRGMALGAFAFWAAGMLWIRSLTKIEV